jgi:hypothetical protein
MIILVVGPVLTVLATAVYHKWMMRSSVINYIPPASSAEVPGHALDGTTDKAGTRDPTTTLSSFISSSLPPTSTTYALFAETADEHGRISHSASLLSSDIPPLPFETFGVDLVKRLGLRPVLLFIDTQLQTLTSLIPQHWSVLLVCVPLGGLYLLRILVGRVNKNVSSVDLQY